MANKPVGVITRRYNSTVVHVCPAHIQVCDVGAASGRMQEKIVPGELTATAARHGQLTQTTTVPG